MAKDITDDLASIMRGIINGGTDGATSMPAPKSRGAFPAQTSVGVEAAARQSGGGEGGDLNETALADRTYWDAPLITTSTDGLITREDRLVKTVKMTTSTGQIVIWSFAH